MVQMGATRGPGNHGCEGKEVYGAMLSPGRAFESKCQPFTSSFMVKMDLKLLSGQDKSESPR